MACKLFISLHYWQDLSDSQVVRVSQDLLQLFDTLRCDKRDMGAPLTKFCEGVLPCVVPSRLHILTKQCTSDRMDSRFASPT